LPFCGEERAKPDDGALATFISEVMEVVWTELAGTPPKAPGSPPKKPMLLVSGISGAVPAIDVVRTDRG
jgi:hypothetical protein